MIKLNGNIYLTETEVEKIVSKVATLFRTSHRAILPQKLTYIDADFVMAIKEEARHTSISVYYLYGYGEDHAPVKKIIKTIMERFREKDSCSDKLYFMQYDLTDTQRKKHRIQYENFLVNVFLEECVLKFKKLS